MKIIHCADIHLGSSLTANFDAKKAKERNAELFESFAGMFSYAQANSISAIIIAGDLFDKDQGIKNLKNHVIKLIEGYPEISVYYVKGNHDGQSGFERIPQNLHLFDESEWTSYLLPTSKKIKITGTELNKNNENYIYDTLNLQSHDFNIVVLHGQESSIDGKNDAEIINLNSLKEKNIDYLSLGHIHTYKEDRLDARGVYCYSGCLEGRGFDEPGDHGFVVLDIDEEKHTFTSSFVPHAKRKIYHETVDISGAEDTLSAMKMLEAFLQDLNCPEGSIGEFILTGDIDLDVSIDEALLLSHFKDDFYLLKIKSKYSIKVDYSSFEKDQSLKGEFVRSVKNDPSLTEEEKEKVIKYGLDALMGKELV